MAKDKQTILVVDDDQHINQLIRLQLEREGFQVLTATTGDEGVNQFRAAAPDLVLLDLMLPGMDGYQVIKAIRRTSTIPVIMLTAKDETFDKVLGLELGADDYMTKPFDSKELIARVKAVLRRTSPAGEERDDTLVFPGLTVSLTRYEVHYQGQVVEMPPKELETLYFLAAHPNQVFTRDQLLEQVWGYDYVGESRTVDVHIKRLREKLPDCDVHGWTIRTVWGVGYKFEIKPVQNAH